ncbi:hypothetical protein M422DRAFT_33331 [Sphaerobolus stellatus SS14]|uniref:Uncharacterized protein n=1 Tax=Sphaerobolus stellatus (strain SS14) TaxID=990650 RepID=A0A0C9UU34_SPHS4|nr:hypothetical protein M422DRAFT_33331 [Sphaerobolus stellatus SS14]
MVWVASLVKAAPAERPLTCFASSLIDHSASSSIEHYSMERIRPHESHISLNNVYGVSEEPRHAGGFSTSPPRAVEMDSPSLSPLHSIETQGYVLSDLTSDTSFQSPENSPRTVLPPFLSGINRTLFQNLSKKERFVKVERPELGQGGYWTINPDASPSNCAPVKIQSLVLSNPDPTWVSASSTSAAVLDAPSSRELGGPSSSFPSISTDRYPDGKLKGRYSLSIRLPQVQRKRQEDIRPSSPRY